MKNIVNTFSILVTERCNLACTYCHFFAARGKKDVRRDMPDDLFEIYTSFIKYFAENSGTEVTYRFSGGDPTVLGDRLFDLAGRALKKIGTKPYVLTGGKCIDQAWIDRAKPVISHLFVSLESPLSPDRGALKPEETMRIIKKYNSPDMPLLLGATVLRNSDFKNLYEVCRIVYEELGQLPNIQEINYLPYESPTEEELYDLYDNLRRVVADFHNKAPLNLFSYISPEFTSLHNKKQVFLSDMDMDNSFKMTMDNMDEMLKIITDYQWVNYPAVKCDKTDCEWREGCQRIKWLWKQPSPTISADKKFADYCRFKKTVNAAFYDALYPNAVA
jgi:pyruvate-formate lyase-activating enzyme